MGKMIPRGKLTSCRSVLVLLILGLMFLSVNVLLLWNQQGTTQNICVCEPSFNVPNPNIVDQRELRAQNPSKLHETINHLEDGNDIKDNNANINLFNGSLQNETKPKTINKEENPHQLAVVVPFRNRYEEMMEFVPHIHKFLKRQNVRHQILVINQVDKHRFNRASLLNIGFLLSRNECDYMVMHDIDLLPLNDDLKYSFPYRGPLHISSPELHPLYHYKTFVGGILIMSRGQFEKVNGLSNSFWGWGREDDELYVRMREVSMQVQYPRGITTGVNTFRHIHDKRKRPRDQKLYFNQREVSRKRDRTTGLDTVEYSIASDVPMTIDNAPVRFVSVELVCNYERTPFCDVPD